jgi:hypothetical protein
LQGQKHKAQNRQKPLQAKAKAASSRDNLCMLLHDSNRPDLDLVNLVIKVGYMQLKKRQISKLEIYLEIL